LIAIHLVPLKELFEREERLETSKRRNSIRDKVEARGTKKKK